MKKTPLFSFGVGFLSGKEEKHKKTSKTSFYLFLSIQLEKPNIPIYRNLYFYIGVLTGGDVS